MLRYIKLGIINGARLFVPLVFMTVTTSAFMNLRLSAWQELAMLGTLQWIVLITYSACLVQIAAGSRSTNSISKRFFAWLIISAIYLALAGASIYGMPALSKLIGATAYVIAILIETILLLLLLAPALAATQGYWIIRAMRESIAIEVREWRWLALAILFILPTPIILFFNYLLEMTQGTLWTGASYLLRIIAYAVLLLPAVSLSGLLASKVEHQAVGNIQTSRLPYWFCAVTSLTVHGLLGAALYFILITITPIPLRVACGLLITGRTAMVSMLLPLAPVDLLIFLLPGFLAGWMAYKVTCSRWVAAIAGCEYGFVILFAKLGLLVFQLHEMIPFYPVAFLLYALIGIMGSKIYDWRRGKHG